MAAFWQVKLHYGVWLGAVDWQRKDLSRRPQRASSDWRRLLCGSRDGRTICAKSGHPDLLAKLIYGFPISPLTLQHHTQSTDFIIGIF